MGIYTPELLLSERDCEALLLLAQLALSTEGKATGNLSCDEVALSPSEASRLLELLEQFSRSKLFLEGSYFAEGIANGEAETNDRLRQIYFWWRTRRGRTNISNNEKWRELVMRVGFDSSADAWIWPRYINRSPVRPMTLEYFCDMERKLASAAHINPRVRKLIAELVRQALPSIEDVREKRATVRSDSIKQSLTSFVTDLRDHVRGNEKQPMAKRRVIAISTLVMDTGALFATRDWTAAGVLSSLAAVAPDAFDYKA